MNFCPSRISASLRSEIEAVAPSIGLTLADSAIGFNSSSHPYLNRTHLLLPGDLDKQVPTMKSLSAWCLKVPIVSTDFILNGLLERRDSSTPLPEVKLYSPWKGESGVLYSDAITAEQEGNGKCQGRRDPLKGFTFISLLPIETEGLVLAAGARVFRAYCLRDDKFFDGTWLQSMNDPRLGMRRIVAIGESAQKVQLRLQFIREASIPIILSNEIVSAVNRMEGVVIDVSGKAISGLDVRSMYFRTLWEITKVSFDNLPPDAIRLILRGFLGGPTKDLISLIRLSASSRGLQRCVFSEAPFLWTVLDLSKVEKKYRKRIRDHQLESLLRRTNAVSVTKKLSLNGCLGLRGTGIAPLLGSTVLQEIDLRFCGGDQSLQDPIPDADIICRVIESMPPFTRPVGISALCGLRRIERDSSPTRAVLMSSSRKVSLEKLADLESRFGTQLASALCCKDCQGSIRVGLGFEASQTFCFECKDVVCGDQNKGCREVQCCDYCDAQACTKCKIMNTCRSCTETYCCYEIVKCGGCGGVQCSDCAQENDFVVTETCNACGETRCSNCRTMDFCRGCEKDFCGLHNTIACSGEFHVFVFSCYCICSNLCRMQQFLNY